MQTTRSKVKNVLSCEGVSMPDNVRMKMTLEVLRSLLKST